MKPMSPTLFYAIRLLCSSYRRPSDCALRLGGRIGLFLCLVSSVVIQVADLPDGVVVGDFDLFRFHPSMMSSGFRDIFAAHPLMG